MLCGGGTGAWENGGRRRFVVCRCGPLVDEGLLFLFHGDHGADVVDVVPLDGEADEDGREGRGGEPTLFGVEAVCWISAPLSDGRQGRRYVMEIVILERLSKGRQRHRR